MSTEGERALGWDDEISNDNASNQELAPPGVYPFEIVDLRRGQHQPKSDGKLPACPKAEIKVRLHLQDGRHVDVKENLYLHSRCEGQLCQFFRCVGQRKHGEPLRPNWARVVGSRGWCKVDVRSYPGTDGVEHQTNDIKSFLDPDKAPKGGQQQPRPTPPPEEGGF